MCRFVEMPFRRGKRRAGGRFADAQPQPLMKVAAKAADALAELDSDLREAGFGRDCQGLARELYASFTATVAATRGTEDESIAWAIGRALATDLHAFGARRGALALLDGLTEFGASHADLRTMERLREIQEGISQKLDQNRTTIASAKSLLSRMPLAFRGHSARSRQPIPASLRPKSLTVSPHIAEERRTGIEPTVGQSDVSPQLSPIPSDQSGEKSAIPTLAEASWPSAIMANEASAALPGSVGVDLRPQALIFEPQPRAFHSPTPFQTNEEFKVEVSAGTTDLESAALPPVPGPSTASLAVLITRAVEAPEATSSAAEAQVEPVTPTPPPDGLDPIQMAPRAPEDSGLEAATNAKATNLEFVPVAPYIEPPATILAGCAVENRLEPATDCLEWRALSHERQASGGPRNGGDLTGAEGPNLLQDKPEVDINKGVTIQLEEHPAPQLANLLARRAASRHGGEFAVATTTALVGIAFYLVASQGIHPLRHPLSLLMAAATSSTVRGEASARASIVPPNKTMIGGAASELAAARQDRPRADAAKALSSWAPMKFGPLVNLQTRQGAGSIQARLKALGYFHYAVDGVWGPSSVAALSNFRQQHGLGPDGVWDLPTQWALLEN
jgi:hypothetical protein